MKGCIAMNKYDFVYVISGTISFSRTGKKATIKTRATLIGAAVFEDLNSISQGEYPRTTEVNMPAYGNETPEYKKNLLNKQAIEEAIKPVIQWYANRYATQYNPAVQCGFVQLWQADGTEFNIYQ